MRLVSRARAAGATVGLEQTIVYAQTALCRTHVRLEALGETVG